MLLRETFRSAWRSLAGNRLRTGLTTLGMIIGVGAVVAVLAIAEGARVSVEDRIRALGSNLVVIRPARGRIGAVRTGTAATLSVHDATAIARLPGIEAVAPEFSASGQVRARNANMTANVSAVTPAYFRVRALSVVAGLEISEADDREHRRVAVIGANVAEALFADGSPLGQRIQISGIPLQVIGVLVRKGEVGFRSPDDAVLVPFSTYSVVMPNATSLSAISTQVTPGTSTDDIEARLSDLLRLRHRLRGDAEDDFEVRSQTAMLETMSEVTRTFATLLGSVAAISLLVGGIGIMNIMLVSVRERTREIGVRMAVGARRRDVLLQFLVEAVLVTVVGGLIGLLLGYVAAALISHVGGWVTVVPLYAPVLSLGVSIAIGLLFGVGPARRAARLDPVEALREE